MGDDDGFDFDFELPDDFTPGQACATVVVLAIILVFVLAWRCFRA